MSDEHLPIFVYGTLQRGEVRAARWPYQAQKIESATIRGRLLDLGPYPALVEGDDVVLGELWHVAQEHFIETLQVLDEIECYGNEDVDLYVRRVVICTSDGGKETRAYVYYFADAESIPSAKIVSPDETGRCHWRRSAPNT